MTRFDADTPTERRKLFADAVTAHRTRGSAFLTIEAAPPETPAFDPDGDDEDEEDEPQPWLQFAEKTFNLDTTDDELDRVKGLVDEFPEFRIEDLESPDTAEGTNVRISARSDANRLADFADRVFQEVYEREADYRAWVVAV
ncbi:hypothetical protein JCM30237_16160 [Halolamina litorea]|uniref:DUF7975 domain-containing protein n=1 Tax=Halolamina litorea TaxID=1515593 RepID=A0ABD6BPA9_9EURY|nr:hypothetical protein [Halolamina litorea]